MVAASHCRRHRGGTRARPRRQPYSVRNAVGRLGDTEWGWVFGAMLFAWIATRAEQAAAEQLDTEQTIRVTGLDPQPWDIGAIMAILPELADACPDLDW